MATWQLRSTVLMVSLVTACSSPTKPGTSTAAAQPIAPADGTNVSYYKQPITLTATRGAATGGAGVAATFEVAADAAFTRIVTTSAGQPASDDHLTAILGQLGPATDYFWRVRTVNGASTELVSPAFRLSVGPAIAIQPPTLIGPPQDSFEHKRPAFTIGSAVRSGPVASLVYHLEIAANSGFGSIVHRQSFTGDGPQISVASAADLTAGSTFYWRVQAIDTTTGASSDYSAVRSFTTLNPDGGTYNYRMRLDLPEDSCDPLEYILGTLGPEIAVSLTVSGNALQVRIPGGSNWAGAFTLDAVRDRNRLDGWLRGRFGVLTYDVMYLTRFGTRDPAYSFDVPDLPAQMSATTSNDGVFVGRVDAEVEAANCCYFRWCTAKGIGVTLKPR